MELNEIQAQSILKASKQVPKFITKSREEATELFALLQGDGFLEELINRIEFIESKEKAEARKKYSRNIAHFYERLLRPVDNVYSATGGSKIYNIKNTDEKKKLMTAVSRTLNGKSLQEWLETNWMPLYHADPNGIIFLEYKSGEDEQCWPTYKNVSHIRNYVPRGQLLEWVLFEPYKLKIGEKVEDIWRLVDDKMDRSYKQNGDEFVLLDTVTVNHEEVKLTFEHPFGQTPGLINSDIEKLRGHHRISPVEKIVELSKEYARDQSIKTLYKKYNGFPKEWKYEDQCESCTGSGKDNDDGTCKKCDGHGYYKSKDVTDISILAIPTKDEVAINPISGYITPPLDIWTQYDKELALLNEMAHQTHWGTLAGLEQTVNKTATAAILNSQPMTDKLDKYASVAEFMEAQLTEWKANFLMPSKKKDEKVASINYGRRYILDSPDTILEKYEKAKEKGDNNVILDRLFNEYLTAKHKNDPEFLRFSLLKANIEPYIHLDLEQVMTYFGAEDVQKKVLFEDWWKTLSIDNMDKTSETLNKDFDSWFTGRVQVPAKEDGQE